MNKFDVTRYHELSDLDTTAFDNQRYSVYVLDLNWNYIYINNFVEQNLGVTKSELIGKNMWDHFSILGADAYFRELKENSEKGKITNMITTSPLNSQRLHITGYPLKDCYVFFSSVLPKKEDLIDDLRKQLVKKV